MGACQTHSRNSLSELMKVLTFVFVNVPCKILLVFFYRLEYFYYRFFYSRQTLKMDLISKRYLVCPEENLDDVAVVYRELFPEIVEAKIYEADLICEHVFELLGSGPKKLSQRGSGYQPIDWHSDFKSGYRWDPKIFYRDICYGNQVGVDIKVPWDLSRFQHLNLLGQAYVLTRQKKYVEEFANQISDWIRNNPVCFGVNWRCTMDVAIRAVNWLVAMEYFADKSLFSKDFLNEFYSSIYEHGKFIRRHLEYGLVTVNHYLANLAGLLFIAVYCPFFTESRKWREFAIQELHKEMEKQVYADGCDFEASTSYHRLVLEMLFYCELLCQRAGLKISDECEAKLEKMFEFSLYCIKPNGMIPQIGDNDSGRFLVFAKRPVLEYKYLLTLAAIYFGDSSFKLPQFGFDEEAFWVFGASGKRAYNKLSLRTETPTSKSFPDAGWFIIRHNHDYCFISCGRNGQNDNGGHAHNDKLSFELMIDGQDVIVDPGTYVYTPYPKERNKFRSTRYHNTVEFSGYEQNKISERNLFNLANTLKIRNAVLKETANEVRFVGEIQYLDFTHKREIILDKKNHKWQVIDHVVSPKPSEAFLTFHLAPDLTADGSSILMRGTKDKLILIEVNDGDLKKRSYDYSPAYGVKVKAECLTTNISVAEETRIITTYISRYGRNTYQKDKVA